MRQRAPPPTITGYMHRIAGILAGILALVLLLSSGQAFGGAAVPWTTCEAEDMATTGTILGPRYYAHHPRSAQYLRAPRKQFLISQFALSMASDEDRIGNIFQSQSEVLPDPLASEVDVSEPRLGR